MAQKQSFKPSSYLVSQDPKLTPASSDRLCVEAKIKNGSEQIGNETCCIQALRSEVQPQLHEIYDRLVPLLSEVDVVAIVQFGLPASSPSCLIQRLIRLYEFWL